MRSGGGGNGSSRIGLERVPDVVGRVAMGAVIIGEGVAVVVAEDDLVADERIGAGTPVEVVGDVDAAERRAVRPVAAVEVVVAVAAVEEVLAFVAEQPVVAVAALE